MIVKFEEEKATKNTIKFVEINPDELDESKIGTLYVRKSTLKEIGWNSGKILVVKLDAEEGIT